MFRFGTVLKALALVQTISAAVSGISDCDETFNYWEPTHFLLHGRGQQTWEYDPQFGLRSYLYVSLHAAALQLGSWAFFLGSDNKLLGFYLLRVLLGFFAAYGQATFHEAVAARFGPSVGANLLVVLLFGSGFFLAGPAFLPSSFCMTLVCLSFAQWIRGRHGLALALGAVAVVLGWPFAGLLFLPMALDSLWQHGLALNVQWLVGIVLGVVAPEVLVTAACTGRVALPALNIVLYNVLSDHDGADLYGREPWHFYLFNGFLNFNVVFLLALVAPVLHLPQLLQSRRFALDVAKLWLPLGLWLAVMLSQAHKEERFLFPVYPLVALFGALGLDAVRLGLLRLAPAGGARLSVLAQRVGLALFVLLSLSRTVAVASYYRAPMDVWAAVTTHVEGPALVCVGKEWYRFPSTFFLPEGVELGYLRSSFRGQLPQPFDADAEAPLRVQRDSFNDQNREEMDRYVRENQCDYVVDMDLPGQPETHFVGSSRWEVVHEAPFLDATRSPSPWRAFYVPFLSGERVEFAPYALLKSI